MNSSKDQDSTLDNQAERSEQETSPFWNTVGAAGVREKPRVKSVVITGWKGREKSRN